MKLKDHPRIRGEHNPGSRRVQSIPGSSPHTRGAPRQSFRGVERPGIIPAYAGSTPPSCPWSCFGSDHPRIRGEHLSRGCLRVLLGGIIPAYAGSTDGLPIAEWRRADHPRIRGEHLSRGCLRVLLGGIIPAYAGSTDGLPIAEWRRADHPRIRGEHVRGPSRQDRESGSSPHTRGARHHARLPTRLPGIIPAYAGSTHTPRTRPKPLADHPRIRGEHRHARRRRRSRGRIIPAYAGSTSGI